jgi:hypothetical protein
LEHEFDSHVVHGHAMAKLLTSGSGEASERSGSGVARDGNGMTALLRAASAQNWRQVRKIVLDGADPSNAHGQELQLCITPPSTGAQNLPEHCMIVRTSSVLDWCEAPGGETSLWTASANGHLDVANLLIEAGGEALLLKTRLNGKWKILPVYRVPKWAS